MTYGEMKDQVLQLLDRYSVAGEQVPLTYNNQADAVARIPGLLRDGLYYLTTTVRRLRAVAELTDPAEEGGLLVYDLPDDFFQMAAGLIHMDDQGTCRRCYDYRLVAGRQLVLPAGSGGCWKMEYFRYPYVPEGIPEDEDFLDCPPELEGPIALYAAAHLTMEDDPALYQQLYQQFLQRIQWLREGVFCQWGVTENVYEG